MNKKQIIKITEQDLHLIVKHTVNKLLKEANNYSNKFNKIKAASYASGKDISHARNVIDDMLAKQAAIDDINKEINTRGNRVKKNQWDGVQDKQSFDDYNDYFVNSNNNFVNPVYYHDLDITPEEGQELLRLDY